MSDEQPDLWIESLFAEERASTSPELPALKDRLRDALRESDAFSPSPPAPPPSDVASPDGGQTAAATDAVASTANFAATPLLALVVGVAAGVAGTVLLQGEGSAPAPSIDAAVPLQAPIDAGTAQDAGDLGVADEPSEPEVDVSREESATRLTPPPRRARPTPEPAPPSSALSDERRLIDRALAARRSGDFQEAMVALMGHERRFPRGALREERDRMVVETLHALGRRNAAVRRALRYLDAYPNGAYRERAQELVDGP
ncbi:MAG: hypothetical protein AAF411_31500 [Myxococcota bacterium]